MSMAHISKIKKGILKMFNKILTIAFVLAVIATALMYANMAKAKRVVEEGLIGYWSFDNVQGDTVPDLVGNNNVVIIRGEIPFALLAGEGEDGISDPKIVKGKIDMALALDGNCDYAESTKDIPISGSDPRTLSAWVKFNSFTEGKTQVPVGWGWGGESNQASVGELFCISVFHGNAAAMWGVANDHTSDKLLETDTWYHITVVYDKETDLEIYVDGKTVYHNTNITPLQTGGPKNELKLTIGKKIFIFGDRAWTDGTVDEIAIYNRPLSPEEVEHNFEADEPFSVSPGNKLSVTWGKIKVSR